MSTAPREEEKRAQAKPRYFWQQNYEIGDESMHWALNDTHSTQEGKVSCCYMVLLADYPTCMDGKPLSEQSMPKRIVDLLNDESSHSAQQAKVEGLVQLLRECSAQLDKAGFMLHRASQHISPKAIDAREAQTKPVAECRTLDAVTNCQEECYALFRKAALQLAQTEKTK